MSDLTHLIELLAQRSVRRGNFTLASGKQSSVYVDARLTTMSPDGLAAIGPAGIALLRAQGWDPDSVGGLTLGADPVAYAIAYASARDSRPIRAFTVRKEAKAHGTGKLIEGPFVASDRVVVIEDVITTGGSALRAVEAVRKAGATVLGVLAVAQAVEAERVDLLRVALEQLLRPSSRPPRCHRASLSHAPGPGRERAAKS